MKIKTIIFLLIFTFLLAAGIIFRASLYNYLWGVTWTPFLSMAVFIAGSAYAIIERNFIVGMFSVAAALLLPWLQTWLFAYWPWFRAHYVFFEFH